MVKTKPPGKRRAPKNERDSEVSTLYVRTDRTTREQFHAACQLHGTTIQANINEHMRATIASAGIRPSATT